MAGLTIWKPRHTRLIPVEEALRGLQFSQELPAGYQHNLDVIVSLGTHILRFANCIRLFTFRLLLARRKLVLLNTMTSDFAPSLFPDFAT
jgi:hypothetical protein